MNQIQRYSVESRAMMIHYQHQDLQNGLSLKNFFYHTSTLPLYCQPTYCTNPLINATKVDRKLELSALSNGTHIEDTLLGHVELLQRSFQLLRRLQNIFLSEDPCSPVHSQRLLAFGLLEDMHRVVRINMGSTPHMAGSISPNRNETKIKGSSEFTDLLESRTNWEVILRIMVIFPIW